MLLIITPKPTSQGCALAEPVGPWHPAFAPGRLENLSVFYTNHMPGALDFTSSEEWATFNFSWTKAFLYDRGHANYFNQY